jgi:YD repeat-containing protein
VNCISRTVKSCGLLLISLLSLAGVASSQNSVTVIHPTNAVTILDSTRSQDGLTASVRRVKTESAKLELKEGRIVEGPRQLVEVTTYDVGGKRVENYSYPVATAAIGKEEYEYDGKGNIIAMTLRGDNGTIVSKEAYSYEFDRFGNWTRMLTSLVVFEGGELKREPVEVTYRSLTYYFDDSIAKMVDTPSAPKAQKIPLNNLRTLNSLDGGLLLPELSIRNLQSSIPVSMGGPPPVPRTRPEVSITLTPSSKVDTNETRRPAKQTNNTEAKSANTAKTDPRSLTAPTAPVGEPVSAKSSAEPNPTSREVTVEKSPLTKTDANLAVEFYRSGHNLFEKGDLRGAVDAFLHSIAVDPNSAEVYMSLGHAYVKLQKDKEAVKAFKECVRLNSEMVEAQYGLGLAYFRVRHYLDAANAFKRTLALRPNMSKAHYGLAMSYQQLNDERGVLEEYRILQKLDAALAKQLAATFTEESLPCRVPPYCK